MCLLILLISSWLKKTAEPENYQTSTWHMRARTENAKQSKTVTKIQACIEKYFDSTKSWPGILIWEAW